MRNRLLFSLISSIFVFNPMQHFFDHLYARINKLNEDADQLTQLEKSTLNEALILLSNEFKHLDKQSALIQEIMQPFTVKWMADTLKK